MANKKWQKPKLIVLVRGRPEEAILAACKDDAATGDKSSGSRYCNGDKDYWGNWCGQVCSSDSGT